MTKILLLIFLCPLFSVAQENQTDSLKTYYCMWTANHGTRSSWGEYDLKKDRTPTKSEFKSAVLKMLGNDLFYKKYLKIEIIAESKPVGLNPGQLAYDIYRYRR